APSRRVARRTRVRADAAPRLSGACRRGRTGLRVRSAERRDAHSGHGRGERRQSDGLHIRNARRRCEGAPRGHARSAHATVDGRRRRACARALGRLLRRAVSTGPRPDGGAEPRRGERRRLSRSHRCASRRDACGARRRNARDGEGAMCGVDWEALRPLPDVAPRYRNRRSRTWEHRRDVYAELPKTPIDITAELGTPIIHAEHPLTHLDSILVFAAFITHPVESVHDGSEPPVVPLPLELTWVSSAGLPLWACTPLAPLESSTDSREYWHKRYPAHRAEFGSRLNANLTGGRWREYRMPVRVHAVRRLGALAIGNAPEVERLLSVITHIGKKGSMG